MSNSENSENPKTFYITTPIYYPNNKLHIGHSYTTVAADTISRYKKLRGYDVKFVTGTDEHGLKIERRANELGIETMEYLDEIIAWIKDLWKLLDIDYDIFIRTTDDYHKKSVQKIFRKLYEQGDIYKSEYEGLYCVPDEAFYTETQAKDGKCPDCGRPLEKAKEESYFLKLSKYQDALMKYIDEHPDFIQPQSRRNEMVNNFLKPGLDDLCVSRTSFKWGIPVDFDTGHIIYVWVDALSNYITALGYFSEDDSNYLKYWPADVQLVGKEIVRFHTIIWPIILLALGEPLPKQVFGHGWLLIGDSKMSKSVGNVVDPKILVRRYGVDAIRYFLLREITFGQDGSFTNEFLLKRINSDLANDLGNLLSRTVGMIDKYFGGKLPLEQAHTHFDADIYKQARNTVSNYEAAMDKLQLHEALIEVWNLVRRANKYVDETQPWVLAKKQKNSELADVLYILAESLRITAVLISPFMPNTPEHIYKQLNITGDELKTWDSLLNFGELNKDVKISKGDPIFPRIDITKELESLDEELSGIKKDNQVTETDKPESPPNDKVQQKNESDVSDGSKPEITIQDFAKLDLRIGEILACEKVSGSDKLLKSQIKIGTETRQVVSGIAKYYSPEQMIGRKVVVVTNLKPVKLRGELSEGMILAASDADGLLNVVTIDGDIGSGAVVS